MYSLSQETVDKIASQIVLADVIAYIEHTPEKYEEFVRNEYTKGNITKDQLDIKLQRIKNAKDQL